MKRGASAGPSSSTLHASGATRRVSRRLAGLPGALEPLTRRLAGSAERHPWLTALAGGAALGWLILLVLSLYRPDRVAIEPRHLLTAAVLASLLALPLVFLAAPTGGRAVRTLAIGGALVGGWVLALMLYALVWDRRAILPLAALGLYAGSLSAVVAGAIRLGRGGPLSRAAVAALALALYAGPFFTKRAIESAAAPAGVVSFVAATSPLAVAQTAWPDHAPLAYNIRTAPLIYEIWVGTDRPVRLAAWWQVTLGWALVAGALWGAAWFLDGRRSRARMG